MTYHKNGKKLLDSLLLDVEKLNEKVRDLEEWVKVLRNRESWDERFKRKGTSW